MQFAMEKRVEILELEFFALDFKGLYTFPHQLLGLEKGYASKHLYSDINPSLHSCGYNSGLKSLRVLHLKEVAVTGEVLEYLLSNCPILERLTVVGSQNLVNLRVGSPSIALKYFEIRRCHRLKSIEICDANLVSFTYGKMAINLLLSNVPLLVEVSISEMESNNHFFKSINRPFTQLSCCLCQLEILSMDIKKVSFDWGYVFPTLAILKHLELKVEADNYLALGHLSSFLKASPCLQRLVLKMCFAVAFRDLGEIWKVEKCRHHYLKVVEIQGYHGRTCVVEHIMYLIKNVAALEKIVIDPVQHWEYPAARYPTEMDKGIGQARKEAVARRHAMQLLKPKVPSTVEFVCL